MAPVPPPALAALALLHPGAPPAPHDLLASWAPSPALALALAALAALYGLGTRRVWARAGAGRG
ncbi:hypothetical protein PYV61_10950, partial [Roseisolibacter sp. H3M3-2]